MHHVPVISVFFNLPKYPDFFSQLFFLASKEGTSRGDEMAFEMFHKVSFTPFVSSIMEQRCKSFWKFGKEAVIWIVIVEFSLLLFSSNC